MTQCCNAKVYITIQTRNTEMCNLYMLTLIPPLVFTLSIPYLLQNALISFKKRFFVTLHSVVPLAEDCDLLSTGVTIIVFSAFLKLFSCNTVQFYFVWVLEYILMVFHSKQ